MRWSKVLYPSVVIAGLGITAHYSFEIAVVIGIAFVLSVLENINENLAKLVKTPRQKDRLD